MWYIAGIVLSAAASGLAVRYILINRYKKELGAVSDSIAYILDGEKADSIKAMEETVSSKILHQLIRLQDMTEGYRLRSDRERDSIKRLITEIAHQLRTPLANMETYLEFLKDQDLGAEERRRYLEAVKMAEEKVYFLTESFIRMSRLEHQIIQIERVETNLAETVKTALDQAQEQTAKKQIKISFICPDQLLAPHDPNWFAEALYNLIDNALKYSPEKSTVEAGAEQNEMYVRVWVRDFGAGIEQGEENLVFQRFYRGKNAVSKEGFGIGLYLAREIVLRHGGFARVKRQCPGLLTELYLPVK